MGSVSSVSGGGGAYQPKESNSPDFSELKQDIEAYFRNPEVDIGYFMASIEINQLQENPNLTTEQKQTLNAIQSQLDQYHGLQEEIDNLAKHDPQRQEDLAKQQMLQIQIQEAESKLPT